jgi:hypothetical protein
VRRVATPAEIEAIEEAHRAAQARLGIIAAYLALAEWNTVSAVAAAETAANWLAQSLRAIAVLRRYSRRLSQASYQLARALETGYTLGLPDYATPSTEITLSGLRRYYVDQLLEVATLDTERPEANPEGAWLHERLLELMQAAEHDGNRRKIRLEASTLDPYIQDLLDATDDGDASIEVDEFEWLDDLTDDEVSEAFGKLLTQNAVRKSTDAASDIRKNDELTPEEALAALQERHETAGALGAGKADKYAISAGRDAVNDAIRNDGRVEMFARKCGPNPCHFCAMLASRGFVYTKSTASLTKRSTTVAGNAGNFEEGLDGRPMDVRKFHDNCHCTIISRWDLQSQLPADNAYYKAQWPEVTKGLSGNDAMNAWRRWMYRRQRDQLDAIRAQVNQTTS